MEERMADGQIKLTFRSPYFNYITTYEGCWEDEEKKKFNGKEFFFTQWRRCSHYRCIGQFIKSEYNEIENLLKNGFCTLYKDITGNKEFEGYFLNDEIDFSKPCTVYKENEIVKIENGMSRWYGEDGKLNYEGGFCMGTPPMIFKDGEGIQFFEDEYGSIPVRGIWKEGRRNGYFTNLEGKFVGYFYRGEILVSPSNVENLSVNRRMEIILKKYREKIVEDIIYRLQ